ncbi:MAG: hypothetical protein V1831_00980 [Candidatus Woesearchaeota archaeon]
MQIDYFLASIITYLGLLLGVILIKIAPDEHKPGKKYFILLKKILFFLILAVLLFFYKVHVILTAVLLVFILVLMLNKKLNLTKSWLVYLFFGVIFYLSSKITELFVIESVLMFLYGIPNASLLLKNRNYDDVFVGNLWFFVPVVLLFLITTFLS